MNIFVLDENISQAAQYHVDKHVVKMPLETAQMLCSAHHLNYMWNKKVPYQLAYKNHPCTKWARESLDNYLWLVELGIKLCEEFTFRGFKNGQPHGSQEVIMWCLQHKPYGIPKIGLTPFAQAMPDYCRNVDAITAYRVYYKLEKSHLFQWTNRERPEWI